MAKILFGAIATDARGKVAGVVYSKNQFGGYIRQKVSPTQTPTTRRTLVRERLSGFAKQFSGDLTAAEVAAWNAFAKNNPVVDVFGRAQFLSGIQAFCRLNAVIENVGGSPITDPPASLSVTALTSIAVTATAGSPDVFSIAFGASPLAANVKLQVYATQPLPPGRTFTKPFLRWLAVSAAAQATPYNAAAAYLARFGAMTSGNKIGVRVNVVDATTGGQTPGLYSLVTIG
jgi:hypothetical protein